MTFTQSLQQLKKVAAQKCSPCRKGDPVLDKEVVKHMLSCLPGWQLNETKKEISKQFSFSDFKQTMVFINLVAAIAEDNDHHPDVSFGYSMCEVRYTTHAIDGLSQNDFICAAKIDLIDP